MALLRAEAMEELPLQAFFEAVRAPLAALAQMQCIGPMPASQPRRAGAHRMQLLLQCAERGVLQQALATFMPVLYALPEAKRARWSLDVDPQSLD